MAEDAIRTSGNIVRFSVRLTPRGRRDSIDGWMARADGKRYLKVRVSAPPEDGKANKALVALLAKHFDVAKSAVRLVVGDTTRLKLIEIEGNTTALKARLNALDDIA